MTATAVIWETDTMDESGRRYTIWHFVGAGCAVVFVLGVLGIGACVWGVTNPGREIRSELEDPQIRAVRTRKFLGAEELPQGYHAVVARSIPWVRAMAVLADRPAPAGALRDQPFPVGEELDDLFDERGLIYKKVRWQILNPEIAFGQVMAQEPREAADSGESLLEFMKAKRRASIVAEGEVQAGGGRVSYVTQLGYSRARERAKRSVVAELTIDCGDGYFRNATWWTPVPRAEDGVGEGAETAEDRPPESLEGTPADEEALLAFLAHFELCS